jgi:hypothetical protein
MRPEISVRQGAVDPVAGGWRWRHLQLIHQAGTTQDGGKTGQCAWLEGTMTVVPLVRAHDKFGWSGVQPTDICSAGSRYKAVMLRRQSRFPDGV